MENKNSKKYTKGVSVMNKLVKPEMEEKQDYVLKMYIAGYTPAEISQAFADHFQDSRRNGYKHLKKLKESIRKKSEKDREDDIELVKKQLEELYKDLKKAGKHKDAADVLFKKIQFLGYSAPKQIDFNVNHNAPNNLEHLTLEQKKQMLLMLNPGTTPDAEDAEIVEE